jgi:hypothetical protein
VRSSLVFLSRLSSDNGSSSARSLLLESSSSRFSTARYNKLFTLVKLTLTKQILRKGFVGSIVDQDHATLHML